jgi:aldehyde dehydrogenase (NAD+)
MVLADGASTFDGLSQALEAGLVDKVGFTGSSEVGRRLGELCGRNLQSPCLELGGKNPLVVMSDAELDLAVEGALFSGFGTAGQRCTSLGTVIVRARARRVPLRFATRWRRRRSAIRSRTCSTGR